MDALKLLASGRSVYQAWQSLTTAVSPQLRNLLQRIQDDRNRKRLFVGQSEGGFLHPRLPALGSIDDRPIPCEGVLVEGVGVDDRRNSPFRTCHSVRLGHLQCPAPVDRPCVTAVAGIFTVWSKMRRGDALNVQRAACNHARGVDGPRGGRDALLLVDVNAIRRLLD